MLLRTYKYRVQILHRKEVRSVGFEPAIDIKIQEHQR